MRVLFRRAAVTTGAAAVVLGLAVGIASAGSAAAVSWSPAGTYDFGSVAAGTAAAATPTFKLTNSGGSATAALKVTITGPFTLKSDACTGTSLGPHKSCTVTVAYTASSPGGTTDTGTLTARGVKPNTTASLTLRGESKVVAKITISDFIVVPALEQFLGVTGTGFVPNTAVAFTASGSGIINDELNHVSVTTDATGAFTTGLTDQTLDYLEVGCSAGSVTVTATDGTNTASAAFNYRAC